jgi:chromosomal replication initiator protein
MKNKLISPYVFPGMRREHLPENIRDRMIKLVNRDIIEITEELILNAVSDITKVSKEEIIGKRRFVEVVDARRIYIYNVKKHLNKSLVYIGKSLGQKDHTTILFSIKRYHALYKIEPRFKMLANKVTEKILYY